QAAAIRAIAASTTARYRFLIRAPPLTRPTSDVLFLSRPFTLRVRTPRPPWRMVTFPGLPRKATFHPPPRRPLGPDLGLHERSGRTTKYGCDARSMPRPGWRQARPPWDWSTNAYARGNDPSSTSRGIDPSNRRRAVPSLVSGSGAPDLSAGT